MHAFERTNYCEDKDFEGAALVPHEQTNITIGINGQCGLYSRKCSRRTYSGSTTVLRNGLLVPMLVSSRITITLLLRLVALVG